MDVITVGSFSTSERTRELAAFQPVLAACCFPTDAEWLVSCIHSLAQSLKFEFGHLSRLLTHLTHLTRLDSPDSLDSLDSLDTLTLSQTIPVASISLEMMHWIGSIKVYQVSGSHRSNQIRSDQWVFAKAKAAESSRSAQPKRAHHSRPDGAYNSRA